MPVRGSSAVASISTPRSLWSTTGRASSPSRSPPLNEPVLWSSSGEVMLSVLVVESILCLIEIVPSAELCDFNHSQFSSSLPDLLVGHLSLHNGIGAVLGQHASNPVCDSFLFARWVMGNCVYKRQTWESFLLPGVLPQWQPCCPFLVPVSDKCSSVFSVSYLPSRWWIHEPFRC